MKTAFQVRALSLPLLAKLLITVRPFIFQLFSNTTKILLRLERNFTFLLVRKRMVSEAE